MCVLYVQAHDHSNNISNKFIKDLAKGPLSGVNTNSGYYVNGFKFHTIGYGGTKETMNSGVCIKGINYSIDESDYYGRLVEVVQVEYPGLPFKRTILFNCEWFDPTTVGMKVHSQYKLVEVNHKRRFNRYEPFVLAISEVEVPAPFQEEITDNHDLMQIDEDPSHLNDPNGGVVELDGEHGDNEDELELEEETDESSRGSVIGDSDNGGSRTGRIRGGGQGISVTPSSSSSSSSAVPSPVAPPPTVVSPPIVAPVSTGSPTGLLISSPSDSTVPPTSSSVEGSSIGPDLPIVHVEDGRLIPSHKCSTTMKTIFMQRIYPEGYTWKNIPNEYKESYFEEFKPACIHEDKWRIWEAYWDRPEVKAKSEQQRKNRMSEVVGPGTRCSRHTGGSRSAIEHYHKLRNELQKEPNLFECFEHMHKKKNGAFVDERSKKIVEEIQARHDAATQEVEGSTEPPVVNMSQLYVDVVGTKASSFIKDNSYSSSATSQFHQDTMKEMLDTMRVEMEAQMEAKLQAERTQMQTQMQAQIASLMDELRRNGIIPNLQLLIPSEVEKLGRGGMDNGHKRPTTTSRPRSASREPKQFAESHDLAE
nr:uncharacterized protein LOC109149905 [Ipomoea batatas]